MQHIYGYLGDTVAIVDEKASAAESTAYKQWLMSVAQAVAEAGKEGGFLGIGAERVSEQEEIVLENYRKTIGLDD